MGIEYNTEWKAGNLNEDFWNEVLVGRKIITVSYNDEGIDNFTLDNGEVIYLMRNKGAFYIKCEEV
ncbi:MAG TPA: hypothetical protein VMX17_10070 [Candidatus Glassbacteria bacterium]|nr:hypothetical protein [Candidatus Glassbacteria bacterium]